MHLLRASAATDPTYQLKVQGYTAANIESAFGIGVIHKRIILPDKDYTEAELRYVLLHEYTHFLKHDTVVKLVGRTVLLNLLVESGRISAAKRLGAELGNQM